MSDVIVAGVGMTPWSKDGRPFVEDGVAAARDALDDAGVSWGDVQYVAGAATVRNGYAGYVAGAAVAEALGWNGAEVSTSYGACASGTQAIVAARSRILAGECDIALVVGADTTPKGFLAPNAGDRPDDPDWLRFRLVGMTNPAYFGLSARRRIELFGATPRDFAAVKVKNSRCGALNPRARFRSEVSVGDVEASPMVADPLRLLDICATSDGGAALVLMSRERAAALGVDLVEVRAAVTVSPEFPNTTLEMPDFASSGGAPLEESFMDSIPRRALRAAGLEAADVSVAEVYDLSTALELDWYEHIGLCGQGEAEGLLRDGVTAIGGRVPVNPSGGLASFGEAVPAQAIAQVCELTWQLRGQCGPRQVEGATVGISANKGLFGHGSSVVLVR